MHLPLCAVTGHLQPAKVPSASSLLVEWDDSCPQLSMAHPVPGPEKTQAICQSSEKPRAWILGDQLERCHTGWEGAKGGGKGQGQKGCHLWIFLG